MSTVDEEWRPVAGYEGAYEVSSLGRVRSVPRVVRGRYERMVVAGGQREVSLDDEGYARIGLHRDGKRRTRRVHVLMAEAFLPRPEGAVLVRHLDGDNSRNVLSNIAWGTSSENEHDKVSHGTHQMQSRQVCPEGHQLVLPNLVPGSLRAGKRRCLACRRAHANVRDNASRGVVIDFKTRVAEQYRQIMGEVAA